MSQGGPTKFTGGCQCGAVRYEGERAAEDAFAKVHWCHCRMCQRAVGNVAATLVPVRKANLRWFGEPTLFQSSSLATRGFCDKCGTPLSFAYDRSPWACVTLGSLDEPAAMPPQIHFGVESALPWLHIDDGLPREHTDQATVAGMVNNQG